MTVEVQDEVVVGEEEVVEEEGAVVEELIPNSLSMMLWLRLLINWQRPFTSVSRKATWSTKPPSRGKQTHYRRIAPTACA